MKILVIGSGAREHAIVNALLRDTTPHQIVVAPGNAGIADVVEIVSLNTTDGPLIADYAAEQGVELVIIGPEAPSSLALRTHSARSASPFSARIRLPRKSRAQRNLRKKS